MGHAHGASPSSLPEAEHAFRSGLFTYARQAFLGLVGQGHDSLVISRLLEIALREGDWDQAEVYLDEPRMIESDAYLYWRGQLALGRGQLAAAEEALEAFLKAREQHPLALEASLSLISLKLNTRNLDVAEQLLGKWTRSDDVRVDAFKAQLALLQGEVDDAINRYERLRATPADLPPGWAPKVYLGLAMGRLAKQPPQRESAIDVIKTCLEQFDLSVSTHAAFALLEQAHAFDTPAIRAQWRGWAAEQALPVRNGLLLALARAEAAGGEFVAALSTAKEINVGEPLVDEAVVLRSRWLLELENADACLTLIEEEGKSILTQSRLRHELIAIKGLAQFKRQDLSAARVSFAKVRDEALDAGILKTAAFNSAILALDAEHNEDFVKGQKVLAEVSESPVRSLLSGEAQFQRALILAKMSERRDEADAAFRRFVKELPEHPRSNEARIARVELALAAFPPNVARATRLLDSVRSKGDGGGLSERIRFLDIWTTVVSHDHEKAQALIRAFERDFPSSGLLPNVHLREMEQLLAMGELESLSEFLKKEINGNETSLQMRFMRAYWLQHLGELELAVKGWNSLMGEKMASEAKLIARHQQALVLCQQGNRDDAIFQWEEIIRSDPSLELLVRALLAMGECLTLTADVDAEAGPAAVVLFDRVAEHPDVAAERRDEALYRKGMVYLRMGAHTQALTAFSSVVKEFQARTRDRSLDEQPLDMTWVYRAGFEAVKLSESQQNYLDAARRADELATFQGPRSTEARERADEIRIKHWLW